MQRHTKSRQLARSGMSHVEVIVGIGVLALLFALVFPAMQQSRICSRRLDCQSNLRNIALATVNYASANGGRLPLLEDGTFGWTVSLLPHLDSAALHRALMDDPLAISKAPTRTGSATLIKVLACPQDLVNSRQYLGLSYAANAGWGRFRVLELTEEIFETHPHSAELDWNRDGTVSEEERNLARATGVFLRSQPDGFQLSLDDVANGDGQASTMLFAENTNARNWLSRETFDIGFVVDLDRMKFESSADGRLGLNVKSANLGPFAIQSKPRVLPGRSPVPSSHHTGIFNVAFADGSAHQVNVNIEPRVYLAQMTWNGGQHGEDPKLRQE